MRIAILGASGIGRHHARIFHALGAEISAILGSSPNSVKRTAFLLEKDLGIRARGISRIEDLWETDIDAVSICTPAEFHLQHTLAALEHGLAVFCEKPFFWGPEITSQQIEDGLLKIGDHPNRRVFVNTSNACFLETVSNLIPPADRIETFVFRFHTQGPHRGRNILLDLAPHGISFILHLFGSCELDRLTEQVGTNFYKCTFLYGNREIRFDFREGPECPKLLEFEVGGQSYKRIQEGFGDTYRVYIEDSSSEIRYLADDPFETYIQRFIDFCNPQLGLSGDGFDVAAQNLRMMKSFMLLEA